MPRCTAGCPDTRGERKLPANVALPQCTDCVDKVEISEVQYTRLEPINLTSATKFPVRKTQRTTQHDIAEATVPPAQIPECQLVKLKFAGLCQRTVYQQNLPVPDINLLSADTQPGRSAVNYCTGVLTWIRKLKKICRIPAEMLVQKKGTKMKQDKHFLLSAFSICGLSMGANAGELPDGVHDWRGPYAGAHAGGALGDGKVNNSGFNAGQLAFNDAGSVIGFHLGWNGQMGNLVYGAEADFADVGINDVADFTAGRGTTRVRTEVDWFSSIRGRVGIATGDFHLFGTAGLALSQQKHSSIFAGRFSDQDKGIVAGLAVGGGIEAAFKDGWSGRIEYQFADFGKGARLSVPGGGGRAQVEPAFHFLKIGITKHFCTGKC